MYKNVSMLLALAAATPVWAQTAESAPQHETKAVQVKLVRVAEQAAPELAVGTVVQLSAEDAKAQEGRGYLGIYLGGDDKHVSVQSVSKGSGAERSGLQAGDVILRLNKNEVKNAEQLVKALAEYKPGDNVAIQAKRGKEQILFMVKLGQRPADTAPPAMVVEVEESPQEVKDTRVRLKALGYGGDSEGHKHGADGDAEDHHHGKEHKGAHGLHLLDARELGLDQLDGKPISEEKMKKILAHLEKMESGRLPEGHGGVTWFVDGETDEHGGWVFAPKADVDSDCVVELECSEEAGPATFKWLAKAGKGGAPHCVEGEGSFGGIIELKVDCESGASNCAPAPECESSKESCNEGGNVFFFDARSKASCEDQSKCDTKSDCGPSDCDTKSKCDTKSDCGPSDCDTKSKCDTKSDCGPSDCDTKSKCDTKSDCGPSDCGTKSKCDTKSDCGPSDCGTQSKCDTKSDCAPSDCDTKGKAKADCNDPRQVRLFRGGYARGERQGGFDPRMRGHMREMMGGRRGEFMKRLHGRMMGGHGMDEIHRMHGVEEIHRMHGVEKMHSGHGNGQESLVEAMQEMTREMRAMRKEMKQLRQQVAKMNKSKATAAKKAKRSKSAKKGKRHSKADHKAKAIAAEKAKFLKMKKAKGKHASHGSFLFGKDAKVVTRNVIIIEDKDGNRTVEVIED